MCASVGVFKCVFSSGSMGDNRTVATKVSVIPNKMKFIRINVNYSINLEGFKPPKALLDPPYSPR